MNVIRNGLGREYFEQSETISVPKSRMAHLRQRVRDGSVPVDRDKVLRSLELKNVKRLLEPCRDYLQYLSDRVMKSMPAYLVEGDDAEADGDVFSLFFQSLVPYFPNSMDHGLKPGEERLERGKAARGVIVCRAARLDGIGLPSIFQTTGGGSTGTSRRKRPRRTGAIRPGSWRK